MSRTNSQTFYYIEVSQQAYDILKEGCKILEHLMCGDLEDLQKISFEAYQKRTGIEVPPSMQHQIKDCIKGLESWGWNRPVESTTRFNDKSDTFRDIYDVLDHQQFILGKENSSEGIPPHFNKSVPQIRVIDIVESSQRRNKPLRVFAQGKSKKRRI